MSQPMDAIHNQRQQLDTALAWGRITPKQHSFQSSQLKARETYLQSRMPQQASQPKMPAPDFTPQQPTEDPKAKAQKEYEQVQGNGSQR
jgi:hypothetical protein